MPPSKPQQPKTDARPQTALISGARVTAFGTLISRILGMLRDMVTASLLGMSAGGVMDAFSLALRIPNLFRRLFGEGALTAAYLPVLTDRLQHDQQNDQLPANQQHNQQQPDRQSAWDLFGTTAVCLSTILLVLVVIGELCCWALAVAMPDSERLQLVLQLLAVMMPYMLFICLAAQMTATLHALNHFATPALTPTLLNICWLIAALAIAPRFGHDSHRQAMTLAVAVLIAGVLQLLVQLPILYHLGVRPRFNWQSARSDLARIARNMGPMTIGLAITQLNTLIDSLIAWTLSAPVIAISSDTAESIAWLGGSVDYPMQQGATASLYFAARLYQFPLGVLGIAVATAIFPLLSRHAARGDRHQLGTDLTLGLRLVLALGVPASLGLMILAQPLATLLFQRGQFTPDDAARTARMITAYGLGVWAFCALPVIIRGYYSLKDSSTPLRAGLIATGINLTLNLTLIWWLGESALALSTSIAAIVQLLLLTIWFSRRESPILWPQLRKTALQTLVASTLMCIAGISTLSAIAQFNIPDTLTLRIMQVVLPTAVCITVYLCSYRLLGGREITMLIVNSD